MKEKGGFLEHMPQAIKEKVAEALKDTKIKMASTVVLTAVGLGGMIHPFVDINTTYSSANLERRAEQLVPGYNPEAFQTAQQVIVDFKEREDLTVRNIDIPEPVTQAAIFVQHNQATYNEGQKFKHTIRSSRYGRWLLEFLGGAIAFSTGVTSIVNSLVKILYNTNQRRKHQILN